MEWYSWRWSGFNVAERRIVIFCQNQKVVRSTTIHFLLIEAVVFFNVVLANARSVKVGLSYTLPEGP